jgi:hypothetical protein
MQKLELEYLWGNGGLGLREIAWPREKDGEMIPLKFVSLTFTKFQFISNQHMHLFCLKNGDGIEKHEYA